MTAATDLRCWGISVFAVIAITASALGQANAGARDRFSDPYSIMAPEPWLAPKYKSPRGLPQHPRKARPRPAPSPTVGVAPAPPPVIVPNGPVVQSLPPINQGVVPSGGRETFSDRAVRCTHQGSLYGVPPGQPSSSYMGSCLGQ
jgi:hypothetical protein